MRFLKCMKHAVFPLSILRKGGEEGPEELFL